MLKMILKDLRLSPLRSILTSVSMLVGIIAMLGSVLVGTLGREYLISVNAQVYGWSPTYSFVITESDFHDRNKMEQLFQRFEAIDDVAAVTFSMGEDIRFAPMKDLTPIPPNDVYQNLMAFDLVCTTEACLIWEQIAVMTPHANIFVIILIKLSWEIRLDLQSVFRQIMPIKNGT